MKYFNLFAVLIIDEKLILRQEYKNKTTYLPGDAKRGLSLLLAEIGNSFYVCDLLNSVA